MKIQNVNGMDRGVRGVYGTEGHEDGAPLQKVFSKTLSSLSKEQYETKMQELAARIDEQGAKLSKRADIKEFEKYRSLVREFMNEVVSNGYEFSKENAFLGRGRHRVFATVKTVDEKLDELGREVMAEQSDTIAIVHNIDDIRGLLLDMML